ncbi:unnamed protein product [Paramecium pentaurelia]|uniref:Thioredoxin-like fold domain-containing protein n=1 Tax=Paramecium pentaurelia TaxID=43138 RepID=A0A8S1VCT1_9CILI|nr:unnamed protein product [Paramecium pentaurelia]
MSNKEKIDLQILGKVRHLIPNNFIIERIKKHELQKNTGLVKTIQLRSSKRFTLEQNDKYDEFCDVLDSFTFGNDLEVIKQFDNFKETIKPKLMKGSTFGTINGVENIDLNTFQTKKGCFRTLQDKTNLIVFWSSLVPKSIRALQQLNELLKQNKDLKLQINPIAISLDGDFNNLKSYLRDNQIKEFEHYRFTFGWDSSNEFQKALELNYLPKIVVVGKDNYVVDVTTKSNKIEDIINTYIKTGESVQESEEIHQQKDIIEKETYKQIKQTLIQTIANQLSQNIKLEQSDFIKLNLIKSHKISHDGNQELIERSQLNIVYDISVQSEQVIIQFLNEIKTQLGNNNIHIQKQLIKDPNGIVKKISDAFQDALKQNNKVIQDYTIKTETFNYVNEKGVFQQDVQLINKKGIFNLKFQEYQTIYSQVQPIFKKYQEEIEESDEEHDHESEQQQDRNLINNNINQLTDTLRSGLQLTVGQRFQTIQNYHKFGNDQQIQIEHKENQILIIFYWNDNKDSDRLFPTIIKFLLANEDSFKDNVRFVALSQHKFDHYQHYFLKNEGIEEVIDFYFPIEENQTDLIQYNVNTFPHFVIIDKIGNIRLQSRQIEDLESLIEHQLEEGLDNLKQLVNLNEEQYNQITQFLQSDASVNLGQFNNKRQFSMNFIFIEFQCGENKTRLSPIINYTIRDGKQKYVETYLKLLNKVYSLIQFQVNKTTQKTLNFLFPGKACKLCQNELNEQTPQYYSPFIDEFYCVKCAEVFDTKAIGNNKLRVKDNLIFFNAPLVDKSVLNDIDVNRLGNNLKVKKGDPYSQRHAIDCNGCDNEIRGFRYIVLNCLPGKLTDMALVDFCQDCFNQIRQGGTHLEKIVKRTSMYGYNPSMLLLRIPFYMGYYEY